ncbi:hypothetical protein F5050DRAFT_1715875 [Lentinula boryana]|uniref:Uncharacterized protein n=1 Tax=Lentinula boryana TaxID=40481 RepID=A0ABQ8PZ48_9AGAR|nr:hypothetical protein F5050DRAFT_1715875 [Lentinula boryana]
MWSPMPSPSSSPQPGPSSSNSNKGKRREREEDEEEPTVGNQDTSQQKKRKKKKKKHPTSGPGPSQPAPESTQQQQADQDDSQNQSTPRKRDKRGNAIYRVGRKDLKEDPNGGAEHLRDGIVIHIRAFMGALKAAMVPDPPTPAEIAAFEQNRALGDDPHATLKHSLTTINTFSADVLNRLRTLRHECKAAGSDTASKIAQIPDDKIKMMFACMQEVGLSWFCPDVFGTPTSYFNLVHEGLALVTFTQVFSLGGYRFLGITKDYMDNTLLMQKLYRSFLMRKEAKKKGSVQEDLTYIKVYKERHKKCEECLKYHTLRGWHSRIKPLFDQTRCHSDHEDGPDGTYYILTMPLRSSKVTKLYYATDDYRVECKKYEARTRSQRRRVPRVPHPEKKETNFIGLPKPSVPLDWFDPVEFNKLPMHIRAKYRDSPKMQGPRQDDWKTMGPKKFMKKYGKEVRDQYEFPTKEEMKAAGINTDTDSDSFEETDNEESEDEEPGGGNRSGGEDFVPNDDSDDGGEGSGMEE